MADESWLHDLLGIRRVQTGTGNAAQEYPERARLIFLGDGVAVSDDAEARATVVTIGQGGQGGATASVGAKAPVRAATTAEVPLSGLLEVDGYQTQEDDRIAVLHQSDLAENGLYLARDTAWVRTEDADDGVELGAAFVVPIGGGDTLGGKLLVLRSTPPITVGVSPLEFQVIGSGDADALRGAPLLEGVSTPDEGHVVVADALGRWLSGHVRNVSIASDAQILVAKLKGGGAGQVLRTAQGGVPTWASLTTGDFGEALISAPLASDQNNWAPGGWSGATVVRIEPGADNLTLRGLSAIAGARRKVLLNVHPTYTLTLAHNDGGQGAGNKILTPRAPFALGPGQGAVVVYDGVDAAWRVIDAWPTEFAQLITFSGGLLATDPRAAGTSEWAYATTRPRFVYLPLESGCPVSGGIAGPDWIYAQSVWYAQNETSSLIDFPLPYPRDGRCRGFVVGLSNRGAADLRVTVQLVRTTPNTTDPFATTREVMEFDGGLGDPVEATVHVTLAPNTTAMPSLASGVFDFPVDNAAYRYSAYIAASATLEGGGTGDARGARIHWVRMYMGDKGPRNG
ncbi:MAG TPA: hypothetical protein VFZ61_26815, partial [Polyangiales bacterium]